ncbi:unnamed protein product [Protopolystoma xenopodis]|uniref:Uncharacterized protein n=1 Tax=Protopolystoma xenopodis TaxID=117903 RepID=A0A448XSS8_9PLAT|nr:unnamed protein product [Protopolystoma xenopodis]
MLVFAVLSSRLTASAWAGEASERNRPDTGGTHEKRRPDHGPDRDRRPSAAGVSATARVGPANSSRGTGMSGGPVGSPTEPLISFGWGQYGASGDAADALLDCSQPACRLLLVPPAGSPLETNGHHAVDGPPLTQSLTSPFSHSGAHVSVVNSARLVSAPAPQTLLKSLEPDVGVCVWQEDWGAARQGCQYFLEEPGFRQSSRPDMKRPAGSSYRKTVRWSEDRGEAVIETEN